MISSHFRPKFEISKFCSFCVMDFSWHSENGPLSSYATSGSTKTALPSLSRVSSEDLNLDASHEVLSVPVSTKSAFECCFEQVNKNSSSKTSRLESSSLFSLSRTSSGYFILDASNKMLDDKFLSKSTMILEQLDKLSASSMSTQDLCSSLLSKKGDGVATGFHSCDSLGSQVSSALDDVEAPVPNFQLLFADIVADFQVISDSLGCLLDNKIVISEEKIGMVDQTITVLLTKASEISLLILTNEQLIISASDFCVTDAYTESRCRDSKRSMLARDLASDCFSYRQLMSALLSGSPIRELPAFSSVFESLDPRASPQLPFVPLGREEFIGSCLQLVEMPSASEEGEEADTSASTDYALSASCIDTAFFKEPFLNSVEGEVESEASDSVPCLDIQLSLLVLLKKEETGAVSFQASSISLHVQLKCSVLKEGAAVSVATSQLSLSIAEEKFCDKAEQCLSSVVGEGAGGNATSPLLVHFFVMHSMPSTSVAGEGASSTVAASPLPCKMHSLPAASSGGDGGKVVGEGASGATTSPCPDCLSYKAPAFAVQVGDAVASIDLWPKCQLAQACSSKGHLVLLSVEKVRVSNVPDPPNRDQLSNRDYLHVFCLVPANLLGVTCGGLLGACTSRCLVSVAASHLSLPTAQVPEPCTVVSASDRVISGSLLRDALSASSVGAVADNILVGRFSLTLCKELAWISTSTAALVFPELTLYYTLEIAELCIGSQLQTCPQHSTLETVLVGNLPSAGVSVLLSSVKPFSVITSLLHFNATFLSCHQVPIFNVVEEGFEASNSVPQLEVPPEPPPMFLWLCSYGTFCSVPLVAGSLLVTTVLVEQIPFGSMSGFLETTLNPLGNRPALWSTLRAREISRLCSLSIAACKSCWIMPLLPCYCGHQLLNVLCVLNCLLASSKPNLFCLDVVLLYTAKLSCVLSLAVQFTCCGQGAFYTRHSSLCA